MDELIKIRDISTKYDISARTLRYYEDMGLINSIRSDDYAYRMYDDEAVKRLEQILVLRKLNISIKDIQRIFDASGSEVVLEVLGKKVNNIDDEVSLLFELKEIIIEFIHQIEDADLGERSDIKMIYEKAKEVAAQITDVDDKGDRFNVERLIQAAEKVEREPDILIVEMPQCRMVTSGLLDGEDELNRFESMWMRLGSKISDKINPRDYMYYDEKHKKNVWLYMLEDSMDEDDTEGYSIITFDGGLFASAIADSWEYSEFERINKGIAQWADNQENIKLDKSSDRHVLYHFAGPHSEQMKNWNYGKVRYFVPIKISKKKENILKKLFGSRKRQ